MPDIEITYNNNTIVSMSNKGTEILETNGSFLTDDVTIKYNKPSLELQGKTVSPYESAQTVTADSGYYGLSQVIVRAISSSYVGTGIPRQSALIIHPSATDQTISSGRYLTGSQTIKGVLLTNLSAENIKKNVVVKVGDSTDDDCVTSVTGTFEGGGVPNIQSLSVTQNGTYSASGGVDGYNPVVVNISGGDDLKNFIENHGTITSFSNNTISTIGIGAFALCSNLATVSLPSCASIGEYAFMSCSRLSSIYLPLCSYIGGSAFQSCTSLTTADFSLCSFIGFKAFASCSYLKTANFPVCTSMGTQVFSYCSRLSSVNMPLCTYIGQYAFYLCSSLTSTNFLAAQKIDQYAFGYCYSLTTLSFPSCISICSSAFHRCYNLLSLYLIGSSVVNLSHSNAFSSTPIAGYTTSTGGVYGSIFVPSSLYSTYIASTNWTYFSSRFVSV